jgi:hypothetical protein
MTPSRLLLRCNATQSPDSRTARCAKSVVEDMALAVLKDQLTEVSTFLNPVFVDAVEPAAAWDLTSKTWI